MDANYVLDGMGLLVFLLAIVGVVLMWVMLDHPVSTALKDDLMLQVMNAEKDLLRLATWNSDHPTVFQCDPPPARQSATQPHLLPIPEQFTRYANTGQTTSMAYQTSASPGWSAFDIGSLKEAVGPAIQYHGYLPVEVESTFQKCRYCGREWPGDSAAVNSGVCWDGWNGCGASLRQGDYDD